MQRSIKDSVVVITGASSGIGRATALEFARSGARLVLAARGEETLVEVGAECEKLGASVHVVPTDVSKLEAVQQLASQAIESFGGIDVWVNDAAVSLFARIDEAPWEEYRQVIETNLFGYIYGARAVIPHFRERGRGVLINLSSMVGKTGAPFLSAYALSKGAIITLSDSIRQELLDTPDIHICTVLPASIDTPIFQHAANYTGQAVKPMNPIYDVKDVAREIVKLVRRPRREVYVGGSGRRIGLLSRVAPGLAQRMMAKQVRKDHFAAAPADKSAGNIHQPMTEVSGTSGHWREASPSRKGIVVGLSLVGVGLAAFYLYRRGSMPALLRRTTARDMKRLVQLGLSAAAVAMERTSDKAHEFGRTVQKSADRLAS